MADETEIASASPPGDVWAIVRIGNTRITRFSVDADETVTLAFERREDNGDPEEL